MPVLWFKGPEGRPFRFQCGPDGINIPSLAGKLQLKDRPLELNGVVVDFNSSGYIALEAVNEFLDGLGGSSEAAIPVTGQAAGEYPSSVITALSLLGDAGISNSMALQQQSSNNLWQPVHVLFAWMVKVYV